MEERIQNHLSREEKIRLAKSQYASGPDRMYELRNSKKKKHQSTAAVNRTGQSAHNYGFQIRLFLSAVLFLFFFAVKKWDLSFSWLDVGRVYEIIQEDEGLQGLGEDVVSVFQHFR